jgi:hypothetical protein
MIFLLPSVPRQSEARLFLSESKLFEKRMHRRKSNNLMPVDARSKGHNQCDQIGRIFTQWAIVYFRHLNENHKISPNFGATFPRSVDYALILSKIGLGYILGVFSQTHLVTLTHNPHVETIKLRMVA